VEVALALELERVLMQVVYHIGIPSTLPAHASHALLHSYEIHQMHNR
jgi:hypothetical protein